MTRKEFWQIVEFCKSRNRDFPEKPLRRLLLKRSPAEVAAFHRIFTAYFHAAFKWDLWWAAYIIEGGCSNDGFTDFRNGLIASGRGVYKRALRNPDTLADLKNAFFSSESYGPVAYFIYEELTGKELPYIRWPKRPVGKPFDPEDIQAAQKRFPKLYEKYTAYHEYVAEPSIERTPFGKI